jgi:hypothetical protein
MRDVKGTFTNLKDTGIRHKPDCWILKRGGMFTGTGSAPCTNRELKAQRPCRWCH